MGLDRDDAAHGATVRRIGERLAAADGWVALRQLINEWNPIGFPWPPDEYDCLQAPLLGMLRRGADPAAAAFLEDELRDHFGLDPRPERPEEFAARLVQRFRTQASGTSQGG
jgi:hypothetical protein